MTFTFLKKTIVIISPEPWGKSLLSKHHFAIHLANLGNSVYFVQPPEVGAKQDQPIAIDLKLISYRPLQGLNRLPQFLARILSKLETHSIMKAIKGPVDVVWSFDPYRLQYLKNFNANVSIYHAVDNHNTPLESRILNDADLVFGNSDKILNKLPHKRKYFLGHGVDKSFLEVKSSVKLPGRRGKIRVGYIGNLNNLLIDYGLLNLIVNRFDELDFFLIGPKGESNLSQKSTAVFDWSDLETKSNVFFLGEVNSQQIPAYLKEMDILLFLYKPDSSGVMVNAHKMLEYFSSGRVIVSTFQGEVQKYRDLIYEAGNSAEFINHLKYVCDNLLHFNSEELIGKRKRIAMENTYDQQIYKIESFISDWQSIHE